MRPRVGGGGRGEVGPAYGASTLQICITPLRQRLTDMALHGSRRGGGVLQRQHKPHKPLAAAAAMPKVWRMRNKHGDSKVATYAHRTTRSLHPARARGSSGTPEPGM